MNRLYWLEFIGILCSFVLLINDLEIIGILTLVINTLIIYLFLEKVEIFRIIFMGIVIYLIMNRLNMMGKLNECINYFDIYIIILSANLSSEYELLNTKKEISYIIKPFICAVMSLLLFLITTVINYNNVSFINIYPEGILSILSLINIIFMPYILCLTLSFLRHEYNS